MASDAEFEKAYQNLLVDLASAASMEAALHGREAARPASTKCKKTADACKIAVRSPSEIAKKVLERCKEERKRQKTERKQDLSDRSLSRVAHLTDKFKLEPYKHVLHLVPRLVNCVTLAEAIPVEGTGSLPLDLHRIAAFCKNSYYAPRRFSAVQLAYSEPRCRVLVFHTGRMVGTGCSSPSAARLALMRAQRQLYKDAGVHIHLRNFNVINQVGAVSLEATLNCDEFASAHTQSAHYDAKSFVGLAWRPPGECICCEVYSTGRANLPGSVVERDLQDSLSRMLPELLRFSSASRMVSLFPEEMQNAHRSEPAALTAATNPKATDRASNVWDGWQDVSAAQETHADYSDDDDVDLSAMGF